MVVVKRNRNPSNHLHSTDIGNKGISEDGGTGQEKLVPVSNLQHRSQTAEIKLGVDCELTKAEQAIWSGLHAVLEAI